MPKILTTSEHKWFQDSVAKPHELRCAIRLIDASDLVQELSVNQPLRDSTIPENALSNIVKLRDMALGTENKSLADRQTLTVEHAQQLFNKYVEMEPRLIPQITIGGPFLQHGTKPGIVLSKISDDARIDFSARDPLAYTADPIHTRFSLTQEHGQLFEEALDKGLPFTLPAGSILKFTSSTPLMEELERISESLEIRLDSRVPVQLAEKHFPVKLISGNGDDLHEIPFVDLVPNRLGRNQVQFQSQNTSPMSVKLRIAFESGRFGVCEVGIQLNLAGSNVVAASAALDFIDALERSNDLRVISLEFGEKLAWQLNDASTSLAIPKGQADLIHKAAVVANFFNTPLTVPMELREADCENVMTLYRIATGEELTNAIMTILYVKRGPLSDEDAVRFSTKDFSGHLETTACWRVLRVFGRDIETGRVAIDLSGCELASYDEFIAAYRLAEEGQSVPCPIRAKSSRLKSLDLTVE